VLGVTALLATLIPAMPSRRALPFGTDLVGVSCRVRTSRQIKETEKMLALAHHYDEPVGAGGLVYRARVYGGVQSDGRWGGWIVFFPMDGGRVIATDRETTQRSLADLAYWASGLTHTYLDGALDRALALQPEEQFAKELNRLEQEEASAALRAASHEAAAAAARTESRLAEAARERTEERFLETLADTAESEAEAHEIAAELSREDARAAEEALRKRTQKA
jgi:hypothetical protein